MLTRYVGMIGLFISITFGLSKNSLIDIKNSNNNLSLLPLDKDDLTGYLQFKKDSLSTKFSGPVIMELNADSDVDLVRKDYVFISNCDSCLLALKMYKFAFDNGMSFSSDIFDPIKTYIYSCYEDHRKIYQYNNCEKLMPLFSNIFKITNHDWNILNRDMIVFQFNKKEIFNSFSIAIREQIAPECNECEKEIISFKKIVKKSNGEIEFKSNIKLQRCIAQRSTECSNGFYNQIKDIERRINIPLNVLANRVQKKYKIIQEIGTLQIFNENDYFGFLHKGVLTLPPSFSTLKIVKLNTKFYIYAEDSQNEMIFNQYGDKLIQRIRGSILIDEENSLVTLKQDGKLKLLVIDPFKIHSESYDKIVGANGGNVILVWYNNRISLLDRKGALISYTKYDHFVNDRVIPGNDLFIMEKNKKQGLVNSKGMEISVFIYDSIGFNSNGYEMKDLVKGRILVGIGGKIGYINEVGEEIVPIIYDNIEGFGTVKKSIFNNFVRVENNSKYGLLDFESGYLTVPAIYDEISSFHDLSSNLNKIAKVKKDRKYGFITKDGEVIISPIYQEIDEFNNEYSNFTFNNKSNLKNVLEKVTLNEKFDKTFFFNGINSKYKLYLNKVSDNILTDFVFKAKTEEKIVAITFDDGPLVNTPEILDILKKEGFPATFFLIANKINNVNIKYYDHYLFNIGIHTFKHDDYRKLNYEQKLNDIKKCINIFDDYGLKVSYFRPAFGIIDEEIRDILKDNNLKGIIWSLDLQDWNGFRGKKIIKQIEDNLTPGDIILFHDRISKADLINSLKVIQNRGFKIVSLEKLLTLEHDFPR
jgi:peptidoglycan-N-acetylglucosamine deacetylase